nr:tetratricopeptide repeat protein [Kitasatospora sp. SID7827]
MDPVEPGPGPLHAFPDPALLRLPAAAPAVAPLADVERYRQAVILSTRVLGPEHPHTLVARSALGHAHTAAGRPQHAAVLLEETVSAMRLVLDLRHPDPGTALGRLAAARVSRST